MIFDRELLLKKIEDREDKMLFANVLDKAYLCLKSGRPAFTGFDNPVRTNRFIKALSEIKELTSVFYGGYENAERKITGFFPCDIDFDKNLFPITKLKIEYNVKFSAELTHRDFLGSVLALGITREKIGDIIVKRGGAVVFANSDIADFIIYNLDKVKNTVVSVSETENIEEYVRLKPEMEIRVTAASLRLDALISRCFNISRGKAVEFIKSERVFVNWNSENSVTKQISEGDIITVRGLGRVKISGINGRTKKDRFIVEAVKYM